MATGGMYDQIGGGFHRYSTDRQWLVPHFEKMLYDNGQLASIYAAAYERTRDPYYAEIVRETLDYVIREMTDASGGFYSAQDAEVNAREGENYIWVADEVRETLEAAGLAEDVDLALDAYGFNAGTNFRDPHHPDDGSKNVVYLRDRPDRLAESMGLSLDAFNDRLNRVNAALLAVRDRRDQPGTDDKVLTGWNGLMIAGLADGGRALGDPKYVEAARAAAEFVLVSMRDDDGGLLRAYRSGSARVSAVLEDYALMIRGLIALHRATGEPRWLAAATELTAVAAARFRDRETGSYFDTLAGQSDLFVRTRSVYDGAVPSGNSIMINNLLDLDELTEDEVYLDLAKATLEGLSGAIAASPVSTALSTLALARLGVRRALISVTTPATRPGGSRNAVTVETSAEVVEVGPGASSTLDVTLHIADGYHINAHEPGLPVLIGLEVRLVGTDAITIEPAYPPGELYRDEILVHRGTVTVPLRIDQRGGLTGQPRLIVTYQVCTDQVCLAPTTEVVPVTFTAR